MATVHVVYDGRNDDLELNQVFSAERLEAIGVTAGRKITSRNVTEAQVKNALAAWYDRPVSELNDHYVEMNPNGNITVRPNAKFG